MDGSNGGSLVEKETNTIAIDSICTSLRKTTLTDYVQNDWLSNRLNRKPLSNEREKEKEMQWQIKIETLWQFKI